MEPVIFNNTLLQFQDVLSSVEKSKIITILHINKGQLAFNFRKWLYLFRILPM